MKPAVPLSSCFFSGICRSQTIEEGTARCAVLVAERSVRRRKSGAFARSFRPSGRGRRNAASLPTPLFVKGIIPQKGSKGTQQKRLKFYANLVLLHIANHNGIGPFIHRPGVKVVVFCHRCGDLAFQNRKRLESLCAFCAFLRPGITASRSDPLTSGARWKCNKRTRPPPPTRQRLSQD